jgi:hypothetical protein
MIAAAACSVAAVGPPADREPETPDPEVLVAPDGTSSYVWPYTSRSRSVAGRTLALNVVVLGDAERVRRALVARSDANWNSATQNATIQLSPWQPAHGSVRYTYVTPNRTATGRWLPAAYQLHVGTYFGRRTHLRAYPSRTGNWTAIQAHTEYWDWFRLRHTVTGVTSGARFVERDLQDEPFVEEVTRTAHGHPGGGSDGQWTTIDLAWIVLLAAAVGRVTDRRTVRDLALSASLAGVVLGVRGWGLAAEAAAPGVTPKLFVVIGYPVLAIGPPALVTRFGSGRPASRIVPLAAVGFGAGLALDLLVAGVRHVPPPLAFHRLALVVALGVLALGASRENRGVVALGVLAWVAALVAPLLGVV